MPTLKWLASQTPAGVSTKCSSVNCYEGEGMIAEVDCILVCVWVRMAGMEISLNLPSMLVDPYALSHARMKVRCL